jgi:16S rRNA (cytosine1402-N4)-methyltransferase
MVGAVEGFHVPVLLRESLAYLEPPSPDCLMVDATQGLAGHSIAFLEKYPGLRVVGVDADPEMQAMAKARLAPYKGRTSFVHAFFDEFFKDFRGVKERPGLILFDFGVSMYHFREAKRGFSMQGDEALDMRLDPSTGRTASDLVNELDARELARILAEYGEEPFARSIADTIVRERNAAPIESAKRLAELIKSAVPPKMRYGRVHPATRSFQALRIAVNDELGRISRAIEDAIECLAPGGIIGAISFHSLEDRIVKLAFRERAVKPVRDKYRNGPAAPIPQIEGKRGIIVLTKKPVEPAEDEVAANPASRSAKFRVAKAAY